MNGAAQRATPIIQPLKNRVVPHSLQANRPQPIIGEAHQRIRIGTPLVLQVDPRKNGDQLATVTKGK